MSDRPGEQEAQAPARAEPMQVGGAQSSPDADKALAPATGRLAGFGARLAALGARLDDAVCAAVAAARRPLQSLLERLRAFGGAAAGEDAPGAEIEVAAPPTPEDDAAVVPAAPRRGRQLALYLSFMSVGAAGGGAIAYSLLAHGIERGGQAGAASAVQIEARLREQQAKAAEAEARLAATVAADQQKLQAEKVKLAAAQRRLAAGAHPPPAASCTLGSRNVRSELIGCIEELNRN